jgi:CHAD domain-containing protein
MTTSPSDPCLAVLRSKIRDVFRHVPKAMAGDEDAVHELRVAGRRLRAALPHLARKPDGRRVRRAILGVKELTWAAGASRDLDVMLACVEKEMPTPRPRPLSRLVGRLRAARRRGRIRMTEALLDLDIAKLRRDLRTIVARGCEPLLTVLERIQLAEGQEVHELHLILDALGSNYEADALHRLRIRARRLRYAVELEAEIVGRHAPGLEILKGLQDDLGYMRDLYLTAGWFEEQAVRAHARGADDEAAAAQVQDLRLRNLSRAEHTRMLADDPGARIDEATRRLSQRHNSVA